MKPSRHTLEDFPHRRLLRRFEGGAVYVAERDGCFYVIKDESTLAALLDEEDLAGLDLVNILEFDFEDERATYLRDRFGEAGGA